MTTTEQSFETAPALISHLSKYRNMAAIIGLVFLALTLVGLFTGDATQFYRSYLIGFWLWFGAGAASLLILMTQYLTGGAWGLMIRKPLEAGAKTLYVMCFFFIPLIIGADKLYWWTTPAGLADPVIHEKALYLNVPFWIGRTVLYSLFLMGMTYVLTKLSKEEAETRSMAVSARLEAISAPGVLIYFLLMTFCAVDFLMTLEPHWYSTVYGFMVIIGQCLTAMSAVIILIVQCAKFEPLNHGLTKKHLHDLGKLLFALIMLWAYLNFSQLLITWSGNLPDEIVWYIKRWNGGYGWIALILLIGHFALPFLLLLSQQAKKNPKTISAIAVFIILVHIVDVYSLVEPNFADVKNVQFSMSWLDITAPLGFGGLWFFLFFRNAAAEPLLPLGAPDLKKALNHGRH